MATTKSARYRWRVKEGPPQTREVREEVIEMVADPFIVAEECDSKPLRDYPIEGPDFLSLDLAPGLSLDEAQGIADFLNDHVQYVAITRFGDADDIARDARLSECRRLIDTERFTGVIEELNERLQANDIIGAGEAVKAVESVMIDLVREWPKAIRMVHDVLDKFGGDKYA